MSVFFPAFFLVIDFLGARLELADALEHAGNVALDGVAAANAKLERVVTKDFGDAFFFVFEVSRLPSIGPLPCTS